MGPSEAKDQGLIALVPLGDAVPFLLSRLGEHLEATFGRGVEVLPPLPHPDYAYDGKRQQYLSTTILRKLLPLKAKGWERVLGVASVDLYVPRLNFVFGEADPEGGVAVFSLFRLRPETYDLPPDEELLIRRALTEAVHELGHTYGLGHCRDPQCVMFFSNMLADTDRKGPAFCRRCQGRLP